MLSSMCLRRGSSIESAGHTQLGYSARQQKQAAEGEVNLGSIAGEDEVEQQRTALGNSSTQPNQ
jgi:hypothetical protein